MTIPRHEVEISRADLDSIQRGELVDAMSHRQLQVLLVRSDLYDQTPGRNGAQLIPVNDHMFQEIGEHGRTGWMPSNSPYVFGIYLSAN